MSGGDLLAGCTEEWARGAGAIDENNAELVELLEEIKRQPFFRLYSVDLLTSCAYIPQEDTECESASCEIYPVEEAVPANLVGKDGQEFDFELDGWVRWDMPSDDYYDVIDHAETYTAYDGAAVWNFIHQRICFNAERDGVDGHIAAWQQDFNRAVSGFHSSVTAHIVQSMVELDQQLVGPSGEPIDPLAEYERRLSPRGSNPAAIENLYFAFMLLLCAVREASGRLSQYDFGLDVFGEEGVGELVNELLECDLIADPGVELAELNLRAHAVEPGSALWQARLRTRDLLRIMNCVQCNICRLHGKVGSLGLATAMQVLLGAEGRGGDAQRLHRVEIAALVTTLSKFASAIEFVVEMERRRDQEGTA